MKNLITTFALTLLAFMLFACRPQSVTKASESEMYLSLFISSLPTAPWQEQATDYLEPGAETNQTIDIDLTQVAQRIEIPEYTTEPEDTSFTKSDWEYTRKHWVQIRNAFAAGASHTGFLSDSTLAHRFDYYLMKHIFYYLQPGARFIPIEGTYMNEMDIRLPDAMSFLNPDSSIVVVIGNTSKRWHAATIHLAGKTFTPEVRDFSLNTLLFKTKQTY